MRSQAEPGNEKHSSGFSSWRYELYSALPTDAKLYATARNGSGSQSDLAPPRTVNLLLPVLVDTSILREGDPSTMVTIGRPVADFSSDLVIDLSSSTSAQIAFPAQVTIFACGRGRSSFIKWSGKPFRCRLVDNGHLLCLKYKRTVDWNPAANRPGANSHCESFFCPLVICLYPPFCSR